MIEIKGFGLSGNCRVIKVSAHNRFSFFLHTNPTKPTEIPLTIENLCVRNHLVHIYKRSGILVEAVTAVEHLFSALYGLNLFNVQVDSFGEEIPFFDGSSQDFVKALTKIKKLSAQTPSFCGVYTAPTASAVDRFMGQKEIFIKEQNSFIRYEPVKKTGLVIEMVLSHAYLGTQKIILKITEDVYVREIAPARTFVFTTENDPRIKNLPGYGIGITKKKIYSAEPLRFPDEPVRHKILDLLGDLYVLQKRMEGKITGKNTFHHLNLRFVRRLLEE